MLKGLMGCLNRLSSKTESELIKRACVKLFLPNFAEFPERYLQKIVPCNPDLVLGLLPKVLISGLLYIVIHCRILQLSEFFRKYKCRSVPYH